MSITWPYFSFDSLSFSFPISSFENLKKVIYLENVLYIKNGVPYSLFLPCRWLKKKKSDDKMHWKKIKTQVL